MKKVIAAGFFGIFVLALMLLLFVTIFAFPVWLLWNWVMPIIFHLPEITLFQAWGLMTLCGLLFKSSIGKSS